MACLQPDGLPTRCGEQMLLAMWKPATPEQIARECHAPLFRVRSAVREFVEAEFVEKKDDLCVITHKGMKAME